jgi:hypothetical protein
MAGQRPRYWDLLAFVWLALALLLIVPLVILLGLSYYLRAAALAVASLFRSLLGHKPSLSSPVPTQGPHRFEVGVTAKTHDQ